MLFQLWIYFLKSLIITFAFLQKFNFNSCLDITVYQIYMICITLKNLEININQNLSSKKIGLPKWSLYFFEGFLIFKVLKIFSNYYLNKNLFKLFCYIIKANGPCLGTRSGPGKGSYIWSSYSQVLEKVGQIGSGLYYKIGDIRDENFNLSQLKNIGIYSSNRPEVRS